MRFFWCLAPPGDIALGKSSSSAPKQAPAAPEMAEICHRIPDRLGDQKKGVRDCKNKVEFTASPDLRGGRYFQHRGVGIDKRAIAEAACEVPGPGKDRSSRADGGALTGGEEKG